MRFSIFLLVALALLFTGAEAKYSPGLEMFGNIDLKDYYINNLGAPSLWDDAARKVDAEAYRAFDCQISLSGGITYLTNSRGQNVTSNVAADTVFDYAISNYKSIYVHPGNYTGLSLNLINKHPLIVGSGSEETILCGSTSPIIDIRNSGTWKEGPTLKYLQIKGTGTKAVDGIYIGYVAMTTLADDVRIYNCKNAIWISTSCFLNSYYDLDVSSCYQGIVINSTGLVTTQRFYGGQVRECTKYGVCLQNSAVGNLFTGTCIEYNGDNTNPDVIISASNGAYLPTGNTFDACWFEDDTFIFAISGTSQWISGRGNLVVNSHFVSKADTTVCWKVIAGRRNVFKGNILDSAGYDGLIQTAATNAVDNVIVENVDDGSGVDWILTDSGTGTTTSPNYW